MLKREKLISLEQGNPLHSWAVQQCNIQPQSLDNPALATVLQVPRRVQSANHASQNLTRFVIHDGCDDVSRVIARPPAISEEEEASTIDTEALEKPRFGPILDL